MDVEIRWFLGGMLTGSFAGPFVLWGLACLDDWLRERRLPQ